MPITVKHGTDAGGLAALALLAGQMSGSAQRESPQILMPTPDGGGGGRGGVVHDPSSAYRELSDKPWHVAEMMQRQQAMDEARQSKMKGWKYEFTERQKMQRMAREEAVNRLMQSSDYTPEQKERLMEHVRMMDVFESPTLIAKTKQELQMDSINEMLEAEGHKLNVEYIGEDGATYLPMIDERGNFVRKLQQRWDQSPKATREKIRLEEAKIEAGRIKELGKLRLELMMRTVTSKNTQAGTETETRMFSDEQIESMLRKFDPVYDRQQKELEATQAAEAQFQRESERFLSKQLKQAKANKDLWWQEEVASGQYAGPEDADLPPELHQAAALLRFVQEEYKGQVPAGMANLANAYRAAGEAIQQALSPQPEVPVQRSAGETLHDRMKEAMGKAAAGRWGGY
jgi:hypothetical protein